MDNKQSSDEREPLALSQNKAGAPLAFAIERRDEAELKRLLAAGASPNSVWRYHTGQGPIEMSALGAAAYFGFLGAARALLAAGAEPTGQASGQQQSVDPLELCCEATRKGVPWRVEYAPWAEERARVMEALIAAGADATRQELLSQLVQTLNFRSSASPLWFKALIDGGARVDALSCHGESALWAAVNQQDEPLIQALLELGANPNEKAQLNSVDGGESPLFAANRAGNERVKAMLLAQVERGALEQGVEPVAKRARSAL